MTLGSGCGSKTLVRVGGGSLKALVTFAFLGIAAYMTLKGLFAMARSGWIDPIATDLSTHRIARQDLPTGLKPRQLSLRPSPATSGPPSPS